MGNLIDNFRFAALPTSTDVFRAEVKAFLREHLVGMPADVRSRSWMGFDADFSCKLAARGWLGLTLPKRFGGADLDDYSRFVLVEELLAAGAPVAAHWIADRQSGPLIHKYGTDAQRAFYLPKICAAQAFFCIGMSEPNAGSDLAAVGTRATRGATGWRLNGRKIWTTNGHRCHYTIALVRSSGTQDDRHKGLSQFIVDLSLPGVSVRPIVDLTGDAHFSEMLFDNVELADDALVGTEGEFIGGVEDEDTGHVERRVAAFFGQVVGVQRKRGATVLVEGAVAIAVGFEVLRPGVVGHKGQARPVTFLDTHIQGMVDVVGDGRVDADGVVDMGVGSIGLRGAPGEGVLEANLVQVRACDELGAFGTGVGHLNHQILPDGVLQIEIPLGHVRSRYIQEIRGTGVEADWIRGRDTREIGITGTQRDGRAQVHGRRYGAAGADDGEEDSGGIGNVRTNLGHALVLFFSGEEDAGTGAESKFRRRGVSKAKTRCVVIVVTVDDGPGKSVLAGDSVFAGPQVEESAAVAVIDGLGEEVVADPNVECQARRELPVVLKKEAGVEVALTTPVEQLPAIGIGGIAEEEVGQWRSRARTVAGGTED